MQLNFVFLHGKSKYCKRVSSPIMKKRLLFFLAFIFILTASAQKVGSPHKGKKVIVKEWKTSVKHGREAELKADLENRTGLTINKLEVGHIDFLRDVAYVKVYYEPISEEQNSIDTLVKFKEFSK